MKKFGIALFLFILILIGLFSGYNYKKQVLIQAKKFSQKIDSFPPNQSLSKRKPILLEMDRFVQDNFPYNNPEGLIVYTWKFSPLSSFFNLRLEKAIKEIKTSQPAKDEIFLWYIYNMGVIIKSENTTVGVDLGQEWISSQLTKLADFVDFLIFSHPHPDHLSLKLAKKAVENGVPLVIPSGDVTPEAFYGERETNKKAMSMAEAVVKFAKIKNKDLIIEMAPGETRTIKGVKITAYPATHRGPEHVQSTPTRWFYFEIANTRFLQTDDGELKETPLSYFSNKVDVLLTAQPRINPEQILTVNPKIAFPLHHHELGHGKESCRNNLSDQIRLAEEVEKQKPEIKVIPIIWGEKIKIATK